MSSKYGIYVAQKLWLLVKKKSEIMIKVSEHLYDLLQYTDIKADDVN